MKIAPVNYSFYTNKNQKLQSFEGLWGKTSRNTDYDEAMGIPIIQEVCYYYPYLDENPEQIQKQIEKNTGAYVVEENGNSRYKTKECKLATILPFTEAQFLNYFGFTISDELTQNIKRIHALLGDKYVNNIYGKEQQSAINEAVIQKLLLDDDE